MKTFSLLILLLFFQLSGDVNIKKAYESNNDYYQGILIGKIKSIDIFIAKNEIYSDKPDYVTRFDSLLRVSAFISYRGTPKTTHTFTYKGKLLLKDEVSYLESLDKPFNKTTYEYDTNGKLLYKMYNSGKNSYVYENDTLIKIVKYFKNELNDITIYNYSNNKTETLNYDHRNRLVWSKITMFDEVRSMVTVNKLSYSYINWEQQGDTIRTTEIYKFDNSGNEVERDLPNDFQRTQYLSKDSKGNWTNKIIYTPTDTIKIKRNITYY